MPYTGNPHTSDADAVRAMVGDTDPARPKLDDKMYVLIVATEPRLYSRSAMAATAIAGLYADQMTKRVGDFWREAKVQFDHYIALAAWLRLESGRRGVAIPFVGGLVISDNEAFEQDDTIVQPNFRIGQQDSIEIRTRPEEEEPWW